MFDLWHEATEATEPAIFAYRLDSDSDASAVDFLQDHETDVTTEEREAVMAAFTKVDL